MKRVIMSVLIITFIMGCANGSGMKVIIKPAMDKRLKEIKPISLHAGLFIEPSLRQFKQDEWQKGLIEGVHHYVFPIGEPLAIAIEEMTVLVFNRVTILEKFPVREIIERENIDFVITVNLKASELDLTVEESVWRAIGKHYLTIQISILDRSLNKIFEEDLVVEGESLDLIDYETEGGWWKISGPKYGPAVEDSIEKVVYKLAERLIEVKDKLFSK